MECEATKKGVLRGGKSYPSIFKSRCSGLKQTVVAIESYNTAWSVLNLTNQNRAGCSLHISIDGLKKCVCVWKKCLIKHDLNFTVQPFSFAEQDLLECELDRHLNHNQRNDPP